MSYKVLARKWRPGSFTDVVGQEHILQSLSHALDSDRLHHALLFTGTRGVGKTTIARILAKALNCEEGISSTPCGKCSSCMAVDEGRFIDLIEVDAASRTKVDDTRELLDNVQYLPTSGRYKVYLIDEVHMLSRSSFNALLKTLEEPPDHVKFLLATTDPQKLPVTVLSRCLQFNLKRLDPDQIKSQLVRILETEKIESENEALDLLARSADGSMRDGLSLLDQAIAFGAGKVIKDDVRKMLGSIEQQYIHALIESLANNDTEAMFQAIDDAADRSPDFIMVLDEMISSFYQLSLAQMAPVIIEQRSFDRQWLEQTSNKFSAEQLQLNYQICLTGKRDLPLAPDSRTGFEMLMLRLLAFRPDTSAQPVDRSGSQAEEKPSVQGITRAQQRIDQPVTDQNTAASETKDKSYTSTKRNTGYPPTVSDSTYPESDSQAELVQPGFTGNNPAISEPSPASVNPGKLSLPDSSGKMNWSLLVESLPVTGLTKQLALHMAPSLWDEAHLELLVDVEQEAIHSATREKELISVLQKNLGENIKISIRIDRPLAETPAQQKQRQAREKQQAAEESIMSDPSVAKMVDAFGASVAPGSIRPVN